MYVDVYVSIAFCEHLFALYITYTHHRNTRKMLALELLHMDTVFHIKNEREREREREMTNVSKNILAASLLVLYASNRSSPKFRASSPVLYETSSIPSNIVFKYRPTFLHQNSNFFFQPHYVSTFITKYYVQYKKLDLKI